MPYVLTPPSVHVHVQYTGNKQEKITYVDWGRGEESHGEEIGAERSVNRIETARSHTIFCVSVCADERIEKRREEKRRRREKGL